MWNALSTAIKKCQSIDFKTSLKDHLRVAAIWNYSCNKKKEKREEDPYFSILYTFPFSLPYFTVCDKENHSVYL